MMNVMNLMCGSRHQLRRLGGGAVHCYKLIGEAHTGHGHTHKMWSRSRFARLVLVLNCVLFVLLAITKCNTLN